MELRLQEILSEAQIYASEIVAEARGNAESFKQIAAETADAPELTRRRLWREAVGRILAKADKRVVPPGSEDAPTRVYLPETE